VQHHNCKMVEIDWAVLQIQECDCLKDSLKLYAAGMPTKVQVAAARKRKKACISKVPKKQKTGQELYHEVFEILEHDIATDSFKINWKNTTVPHFTCSLPLSLVTCHLSLVTCHL
jgi:hypothetical protein